MVLSYISLACSSIILTIYTCLTLGSLRGVDRAWFTQALVVLLSVSLSIQVIEQIIAQADCAM